MFTDRPLGGNPLAVVHGADGLEDAAMQSLAAEFGISETAFVTSGGDLRIFTPAIELPGAGHPVVGAALDLARRGIAPAEGAVTFRTGAGDRRVELSGGSAVMTQGRPEPGPELDASEVAPLLGLEPGDLVGPPAVCSTGVRFVIAQVRDRSTLARAAPDLPAIAAIADPALGVVPWCETGPGELRQRMFAPRMGLTEDPATGSAAGALGALRVLRGESPGALVVRQGDEIGRPSRMAVEVPGSPGAPGPPRVGGRAALVAEGTLERAAVGC